MTGEGLERELGSNTIARPGRWGGLGAGSVASLTSNRIFGQFRAVPRSFALVEFHPRPALLHVIKLRIGMKRLKAPEVQWRPTARTHIYVSRVSIRAHEHPARTLTPTFYL